MKNNNNGSFIGLVPLIVFVLFYLGAGIILQLQKIPMAFYQLPSPIAAFIGIVFAFILFKGSIKEKFNTFLEGCGHQDIITMCIIYLLAGAFAGVAKTMGGVDSTVNLALSFIPVRFLAPSLFVIAAFISTATGTSVGAIVSIAPIAVGLADKSGVSLALILAAVMGGAMFGDNLSVISDTTIASTRTQGVEMKDKFRVNLNIALPAAILTVILFFLFGAPKTIVNLEVLDYSFLKIVPYLSVLILALSGINVFVVLTLGIVIAGIIGIFHGNFTFLTLSKEIYNGFTGMNEIFLLSLFSGGLANMTSKAGGIQWLIGHIQKLIIGKKSAKLGIGILVSLIDMAVANNTVAIIISGPIAKNISKKYDIDPKESAAILDIFSCIFQGIIPYGAQMLILLSFASEKVSPIELISLLWYQMLLLVFTLIFIKLKDKKV
ncbi:Na+/H+ antiporter NhaC family protein [Fusobacterium sp.]|uniref:Na+/H+ antiporter NhaC family protein n=1 Tax=Fusobacterium sp. TaxID=68766 RepID=UPI0025C23C7F|nr:Na+/H+ antiporter NhaC family protein [Fusobacterium sp.]